MGDPRIAIVPPYTQTLGPQVTKIAGYAGIRLDAAQQLVIDAFCGYRPDGKWTAFEGCVFAPRQNLKTELLIARIIAGLYLFREKLIVFSAHRANTTAEVFRRVREAIEGSPQLAVYLARVSNKSGAETIELTTGHRLQCVARSTNTGRGFVGDTVLLDEAMNLDADHMGGLMPMLSTKPNPQLLYALSFGDEESTFMAQVRKRAIARVPGLCWIEWSMDPEADVVGDRDVWARCNPAVESGRISMEYLEREYSSLGPVLFAKERLGRCNWPVDETSRFAVITKDEWARCLDPDPARHRRLAPVSFGIAADRTGRTAAVCVAGTVDGIPVFEVADYRPGEGCGWLPGPASAPHPRAPDDRRRVGRPQCDRAARPGHVLRGRVPAHPEARRGRAGQCRAVPGRPAGRRPAPRRPGPVDGGRRRPHQARRGRVVL
jgi:hypothetical protein